MRINSLYMTHFGCFHQRKLDLYPGINVIYGENEAGKSTVHQFIQAMLFGVERLRGKASKKDEYSRFQPWDGGRNYEGAMEIEHDGETYRLVRNFYKEDEIFKVEQLSTGKEILLPGGQVDALVEGLTRNTFQNTLSIRQLESRVDARFGLSLQAYMANIQRTKSQDVDLGRTLDYLRKEKKSCLDRSSEKRLQELQLQMDALDVGEVERQQLQKNIQEQQEQLDSIRKEMKSEHRADMESRKIEQKERLEAIRLIEENNHIAAQYQQKRSAYEKMKQEAAEDDFDELKEQWEEANETYDALSDRYSQLMGRNLAILFSIAMFGLIPVLLVFFLKNSILLRMGAVGIFIVILLFTAILLQSRRRHMGKKVRESKENLDEIHDQMEQHMFGHGSKEQLRQLKEEMQLLRKKYEEVQIPLQPYLEKYGDDISLDMDEDMDNETVQFLREKEEKLTKSLERLLVQKEMLEQKDMDRENLELEIRQLSEEVDESRKQAGVIDECIQIIHDLSEDIHSDFGPALNQEMSRMLKELTKGKYERVVVDNEMHLKVDTGSGFVDAEQLSSGTREQLYLALRLAMIRLLFPKKNMPVILDDSFVFYDDNRLKRTLAWIHDQGFEQVIIFSCQHREMDALEQLGVAYQPIYLR